MKCLQQSGYRNSDVVCLLNSSLGISGTLSLMNEVLLRLCASHWSKHIKEGAALESEWEESLAAYEKKYPTEAAEFKSLISLKLPEGWEKALPVSLYLWNLFLCKTAKPRCLSCSFSLMLCVLSVDDLVSMVCGLRNA